MKSKLNTLAARRGKKRVASESRRMPPTWRETISRPPPATSPHAASQRSEPTSVALALYRGRSKHALVQIVRDGLLYRIAWPDLCLSDLCNLTRAKAAALEWAEHKERKLPAAQQRPLRWRQ